MGTIENIASWILKILVLLASYFAPIAGIIHLVLGLILIDLLTGIYASVKLKEKFSARKLRYTVEKFVFYSIAIIAGYMMQLIFFDAFNVSQIVAGYIALTESKSIYENISKITKIDIFMKIYKVIKERFESKIKDTTEVWTADKEDRP
jgi:phage-related holin